MAHQDTAPQGDQEEVKTEGAADQAPAEGAPAPAEDAAPAAEPASEEDKDA